jgi:hypothetical protein
MDLKSGARTVVNDQIRMISDPYVYVSVYVSLFVILLLVIYLVYNEVF